MLFVMKISSNGNCVYFLIFQCANLGPVLVSHWLSSVLMTGLFNVIAWQWPIGTAHALRRRIREFKSFSKTVTVQVCNAWYLNRLLMLCYMLARKYMSVLKDLLAMWRDVDVFPLHLGFWCQFVMRWRQIVVEPSTRFNVISTETTR